MSAEGYGEIEKQNVLSKPATYDSGERSIHALISGKYGRQIVDIPPDAEIEPRSGTHGMTFAERISWSFSMSSNRTPECPRIREFIRISIAPRTQASGIVVELPGSERGRTLGGSCDEGKIPV